MRSPRTRLRHTTAVGAAALALALASCSSDDENGRSDGAADDAAVLADSGPAAPDGAPAPDKSSAPDQTSGQDGSGPSPISNPFGFAMRMPVERTVSCPDAPDYLPQELTQLDMDWLCTFVHGDVSGQIYVQSTPVACTPSGMSMSPVLEIKGAFIATGGKVAALGGASYDWGGNHNNDELGFDYGGKRYRYYHSSFGFGWRKCQPMDCMQVLAAAGGAVQEDGCTPARTLPVVCLQVDGTKTSYTEADLATDPFAKCPGDENP